MRQCGIHLRINSHWVLQLLFCNNNKFEKLSFKIIFTSLRGQWVTSLAPGRCGSNFNGIFCVFTYLNIEYIVEEHSHWHRVLSMGDEQLYVVYISTTEGAQVLALFCLLHKEGAVWVPSGTQQDERVSRLKCLTWQWSNINRNNLKDTNYMLYMKKYSIHHYRPPSIWWGSVTSSIKCVHDRDGSITGPYILNQCVQIYTMVASQRMQKE